MFFFYNSWHWIASQYKKDGSGSVCTQKHCLKREARIHQSSAHKRKHIIAPETKGLLMFLNLCSARPLPSGSQWFCSASRPCYTIRLRLVMVQRPSKGFPLPLPHSPGNVAPWPEIVPSYWRLSARPHLLLDWMISRVFTCLNKFVVLWSVLQTPSTILNSHFVLR